MQYETETAIISLFEKRMHKKSGIKHRKTAKTGHKQQDFTDTILQKS